MEVGNSKEVWFKSCVDLVISRFFATDFGRLSITGIQVLKVTRIHNRFLQDRFERILDAQVLQMQKGSKMHVEYLLYGEMLQAPDELQWIIEEGFPFAPEHVPNGSQGPVVLSNSVGLADMCRLQAIAEHLQEASWRGKATGWLLVVKTCLGSSVRDLNCTFTKNPCVPFIKNGEMHPNTDGEKTVPAKKSLYPNADSVYRSHPLDPLQRSWSVFDSSLVVPEYLVEFEYVFKMEDPCGVDPVAASPPLQRVATELPKVPGLVNGIEESSLGSERGASSSGCQLPVADAKVVHPGADVLDALAAAGPAASQATGTFVRLLSTNYLQKRNGLQDFSHVSYLNLHNSNLTGMEVLQGITGLKILILSFNKICKITGLDDFCVLEQLDLSYNALSRIEGLSGLNNLLTLDLAGNEIWCRDDIGLLQLQVQGLLNLNLRSNPLVEELGYQSLILRALPLITQLDCNPITTEDHISAIQKFSTSPATLFSSTHLSNCKSQPPSASAVSLLFDERDLDIAAGSLSPKLSDEIPEGKVAAGKVPGLSGKDKVAAVKSAAAAVGLSKQMTDPFRLSPYRLNQFTKFHRIDMASKRRLVHSSKNEPVLYEGIEEVHLEWRKLRTMYCFDSLPNLRRLFLSGNEISMIDGLENATMLEELILEDNLIKQVTGLENLHTLWRLDLGCNQLTSCLDMSSLVSIEQLSIDGNQIPSLKGLEGLLCLMELYAQNNLLLDMAEINYIGNLPKLMVVNLSGNALCGTHDYRPYTIYTLRKLKVLDGTNVDSTELTEARNKYKGRLTRDMLKDCIGHKEFSVVKALDLSDQRIRHCGDVFESRDLMGLTELNLNDNMISSIQTLRFLTNLVTLRLDNNSFENGSLLTTSLAISATHATLTSMAEEERQGNTIDSVPSTSERGLESLEMSGNSISSIISLQLSFASKLKNLSLHNNKIIRVDGLEGLRNLEQLYLNHNSIKELEPSSFSGLQKLQILHMGDNALKTLVHLGSLLALVSLDMTSNLLTPSRLGGLSSIDNLSPLPNLAKLWLTNNPISRQNNYRIAVISRLKHLQQLDGRDVTEEERQEAEAYLLGGKEPTTLMMDPNVLLDSLPNSLMLGGQTKVPLKVTSLNFDNLCAAQTSTTTYTTIVANAGGLRGLNGFFSHANHVSGNSGYNNTGQKQLGEQFVDGNKQMAPLLQRKGNRGENKVLLLPIQNFLKNISPAKDGIMHTTMCELPCPKKSSLCLS
ncbi:hypothetical protein CY35_02G167000 [Sphagnum magellanicum]|nr:hypothetical protein CY35_02G167000 [Sphagnum magellanicum]